MPPLPVDVLPPPAAATTLSCPTETSFRSCWRPASTVDMATLVNDGDRPDASGGGGCVGCGGGWLDMVSPVVLLEVTDCLFLFFTTSSLLLSPLLLPSSPPLLPTTTASTLLTTQPILCRESVVRQTKYAPPQSFSLFWFQTVHFARAKHAARRFQKMFPGRPAACISQLQPASR